MFHENVVIPSKGYWDTKYPNIDFEFIVKYLFMSKILSRKCQVFNWRIFHGQINTESRLLRMKLSNGTCKICKNAIENIDHMLILCTGIKSVWDRIEIMISKIRQQNTVLSNFDKTFGFTDIDGENEFCNVLSISRWII